MALALVALGRAAAGIAAPLVCGVGLGWAVRVPPANDTIHAAGILPGHSNADDILAIPRTQINDVRVLTTIVGGRIVHQRKP